jgi:hypothetical protein
MLGNRLTCVQMVSSAWQLQRCLPATVTDAPTATTISITTIGSSSSSSGGWYCQSAHSVKQ